MLDRRFILFIAVGFASSHTYAADIAQFVCTVGGVYTNQGGKLVQRPSESAVGKLLYVNVDTGEVTGHFGTDGFKVFKVKRPDTDEFLTIETAVGIDGDVANRLSIERADEKTKRHSFIYNKGWLVISGACEAIRRH